MNPHGTRRAVAGRRRSVWRRRLAAAAPLIAFASVLWLKPMGLLLWARIRILTNIPRTAIAEPKAPPSFSDLLSRGSDGVDGAGDAAFALPDRADPSPECGVGEKSSHSEAEVPGIP